MKAKFINAYHSHHFFFFKIFLMWTLFYVFIEFVTVLLLVFSFFLFFFFEPQSMWDLSFLTSLWTHTPCVGRWSHSHWISREVPNVTPNISIKVILDILQNFAMLSQQYGKESACHAGDLGSIPGSGRPLENEMATHSSVLAWRIPGTGHPGGLPSMGSHRVEHDWSDSAAAAALWLGPSVGTYLLCSCISCSVVSHSLQSSRL